MKKTGENKARISQTGTTHRKKHEGGFTIVETLMVLAIAGVILIIILLAVPTLNRNARNHTRRVAVNFIAAAMTEYYGNNGHFPMWGLSASRDDRTSFVNSLKSDAIPTNLFTIRYIDRDGSHEYPFGGTGSPATPTDALDEISIEPGHRCNRDTSVGIGDIDYPLETAVGGDNNHRAFVVWTQLEQAPVYCVDNALR